MQQACHTLAKVYKTIVAVLVCAILTYLCLLSLFSSSHVHVGEVVYYTADSPWLLLLAFAALCTCLTFLRRVAPRFLHTLARPWVKRGILLGVGLAAVVWVCTNQLTPVADQYYIMEVAADMRAGDFSEFLEGGYIEMHHHQMGIVLFAYLLSFPFGVYNYLAFRLVNVAGLLVCYAMLYKINTASGASPRREGIVLVVSVLFLPLFLYTTFVYGTILGFALALVGMWQALLCLQAKSQKARVGHILLCAVAFALSIALKGNYLVMAIAACIMLVVYACTHRRVTGAVCAAAILLVYFLFTGVTVQLVGRAISGAPLDQGIPTTARIAMGLQESPRAPGWYNDYVTTEYIVNDYDTKKTSEAAVHNLQDRLEEFAATPFYAVEFFGLKTASQWNDGTFASLWVTNTENAAKPLPYWSWTLISGGGAVWFMRFCNLYHSLVLLGALAWFVLRRQQLTQRSLYMALTFLGGFLLYLVWEAKSQYTLPFFFLLIPYAVEGYAAITARMADLWQKLRAGQIRPARALKTRLVAFVGALLVCVAALSFAHRHVLDVTLKPAGDDEYYDMVVEAYSHARYDHYLEEAGKEE